VSDLSGLPRFIVKFDDGIPLRLLLLLSGDIELHPGPSVLHPCGVCTLEVADSHKALCCDMCDQWVHVACDPSIDESTYDDMVAHPTSAMWYCFNCSHFEPSVDMSNSSTLKCVCMNVRSICAKKLDLFAYVAAHPYDIIAITETFLDPSIDDSEFAPRCYSVFRRDRNRHGGGVMMLIRDHIPVTRRFDLETTCEILWIQIATQSHSNLLLGVYYRPPGTSVEALVHLNNSLMSLSTCNLPLVLCGDFNVPNIDWVTVTPVSSTRPAELLCTIVADNSLAQLVDCPTRECNILDLVLANHDCVSLVNVTDNLPSTDHFAIEFSLSVNIPTQSRCRRTLYNYKKADFNLFREVLSHIPWDITRDSDDIEYSWSLWKDLFFSAVNQCVPTISWKRKKMKYWFSDTTVSLIHKKRQLYLLKKRAPSQLIAARYRKISNIVRHLTRYDTKHHVLNICDDYSNNPKKFWSWVNRSKGYRNPIPSIVCDDTVISDDVGKASCFNEYFSSVFTVEDLVSFPDVKSSTVMGPDLIDSIQFTPKAVFNILHSLSVDKACGPDLIPAKLLKEGAESICVPLSYLFQQSFEGGTLPFDWVSANVVPVFKRDDRHNPANYRPISLTSLVVKIMEKIIHSHIVSSLESLNLLNSFQFGFRSCRSTVDLLLRTSHDMALALEHRSSLHCLLLDFSKAFDSVPHERLLLKLDAVGVRGKLLAWIRGFLTCRVQRVVVNGSYSSWLPVRSGVPQGSVLGPLLFIIYVNDIYSVIHHSRHGMFADDLALYREVCTLTDCELLQGDLSNVSSWSQRWQLKLNWSKCEAISITNKRNPLSFSYTVDCHPIQWSPQVHYLGVIFDSHLKWSAQCHRVASKATRVLNILRRSLFNCHSVVKSLAYISIVRPHLEYASIVWNPHTSSDIKLLEAVQNRAARWICATWDHFTYSWNKSSHTCLSELKWPTLSQRRTYFTIDYLHSILHHMNSFFFKDYFQFNNSSSTRSHQLTIRPVHSSINPFRFSFFVNSIFLWNRIPFDILSISCKSSFRCKLRSYLW